MGNLNRVKITTNWTYLFGIAVYTCLLLLIQAAFFSRLPYPAFRADLLLPLMFGVAIEWSPLPSLFWAALWGFVMDTFSGVFWGFHVGSYVAATCLVNIAVERFDFQNPLYQVCFVGVCALGQSVALGLYLTLQPGGVSFAPTWMSLTIRALFIMIIAPFVLYPLWHDRGD